ncbi:hypothetical protein [Pseudomonas sp. NPDC089401]|uniref:hypothetical protein n=1 Tax=Pseudomonas sp. NPDC089401 TaxID=3364462 RepID=UPI0038014306
MWFIDLVVGIFNLLGAVEDFRNHRPRRVFTRGFVLFCIFVVIFELLFLHNIYSNHPGN